MTCVEFSSTGFCKVCVSPHTAIRVMSEASPGGNRMVVLRTDRHSAVLVWKPANCMFQVDCALYLLHTGHNVSDVALEQCIAVICQHYGFSHWVSTECPRFAVGTAGATCC